MHRYYDAVGREKGNREGERNTPNRHIESGERFTQRGWSRNISEIDSVSDAWHLDEFVKERTIGRVLSDFEAEADDMLVVCIARTSRNIARQLGEPSKLFARRIGAIATSGGPAFGQTTG